MVSAWLTTAIVTGIWGFIGIVCPFFVPKRPDRGIIQTMFVLTAACCYLLKPLSPTSIFMGVCWLCTFLMQLNPLFGPQLEPKVVKAIMWQWDGTNLTMT